MKWSYYIKLDPSSKVLVEISAVVYFKIFPTFNTGQDFISVHTGDPKLDLLSDINPLVPEFYFKF
jgi:hypothetical protein